MLLKDNKRGMEKKELTIVTELARTDENRRMFGKDIYSKGGIGRGSS